MPTVADLAAAEFQEIGFVLFCEGWRVAWTNRAELAGSGPGSWISQGSDYTGDTDGDEATDRVVVLGLEVPDAVKLGIGIVETGMLVGDEATFGLVDRDDHMIEFAEDEAGSTVFERLDPTQDPAPSTLIDGGGQPVDLHGKHINGEAIGDAGERRRFQIFPTVELPGLDHAAVDSGVQDLRASTVREAARWLEGRAVALYLIRKDPDAGTWPSWAAQYESGYSLVWWGSLKGASAESRAWRLECEGPSSWLRRPLNANRPADWKPCRPVLAFGPGEDRIASSFIYSTAAPLRLLGEDSAFTASDVITDGQTPAELADEINTRLQTVAGTAGPDITWSTFYNASVALTDESLAIRIADNNGGNAYGAILALRMHHKAWLHLGWDLTLQKRTAAELSTTYELEADLEPGFSPVWLDAVADPAPGYWTGYFNTCPVGLYWSDSPTKVDGDGAVRVYTPIYPGGVGVLQPDAGQEWTVGFGLDVDYIEGQLARPPADKLLDAGACNATGFFAVRAPYRTSIDGDPETRYALAKVSWKKATTATTIALDGDANAVVWCEQWLDATPFGAGPAVPGPWAVSLDGACEFVPVALLGYNLAQPDLAHVVLLRLLLSTGTASWSGYEGEFDAAITPGDNGHPDALLGVGEDLRANDMELADLGLGIPADLVDWSSFVAAADALPGGKGGPLNRTRLAYVGPFDSQQAIQDIITPRGWCFSLRGGRYGLFARSTPLDPANVDVVISPSDIAGEPDELPPSESVDFRPLEPLDLVTVTYGRNQLGDGGDEKTATIRARDPRAQQRRGNATVDVDGRSLLPGGQWMSDFRALWGDELARFYGEPHALVTVRVKGDKARDLWPGAVVRYTSPWPATRAGAYGMTAQVGRVVSVSRNLQTLAATCEILIAAGDTTTNGRRFAPLARLVDGHATVEARHNAGTRTLTCYADAWGRGGSVSDVAAFTEPAWLGVGGEHLVNAWASWDGLTWEQVASFEVSAVDTATNTLTYSTGTLTGSIPERRYVVLVPAPWDDQSASSWPRTLFGVVAGSDGKFGAGNVAAYPWSP